MTGRPLPLDADYLAALEGADATAHELLDQALPVAVVFFGNNELAQMAFSVLEGTQI